MRPPVRFFRSAPFYKQHFPLSGRIAIGFSAPLYHNSQFMRARFYLIPALLLTFFWSGLTAQETHTHIDGRTVMVYADGSWVYLGESNQQRRPPETLELDEEAERLRYLKLAEKYARTASEIDRDAKKVTLERVLLEE